MERGDILAIIFLIVLIISLIYLYQNLSSFECFIERSFNNVMSDVSYEFEPEGSLYGKSKIFRFTISSSRERLEYFGMKVMKNNETLFFENRTEAHGGSIIATINETENLKVDRFFKKKCYSEVHL
ncbi:MAG: hypothetical protein QXD43_02130 [Candidatus Aenigmatarchaeota archaeon]